RRKPEIREAVGRELLAEKLARPGGRLVGDHQVRRPERDAVRVEELEWRALAAQASASSTGVGAVRAQSTTSARIRSRSRVGPQPIACRTFSIDGFRLSMSSMPCP